ncbi:Cof-type HAD-IIB family hydrolase [Pseudobutyrivibrio ruminis]|uniref:Cof-type HAD-IIB family hydrolase n=1 Tax=Pseudobutyrivibrio ruminis TaxID=46206 RepID=UPI0003FD97B5|nr:Cof-type HAD-IIB family hydrolase [Pseudobutyrivibrio ruminis]
MSKKILAVDMDGTLFNDDKTISKENIDAITALLDAGHIFAFNTGRPNHALREILSVYDEFMRDNVYILGHQGVIGTTMKTNDTLFGDYINNDDAREVITEVLKSGFTCVTFDAEHIYTFNDNKFVESYKKLSKEQLVYLSDINELKDKNITKLIAIDYDHPENLQAFKDNHEDIYGDRFESFFSHYAFLEYIKKGTGKGDGVVKLANHLGISIEDIVTVGDERNDISMIKAAGIGVAVANAREELKAIADYVTVNDNNNGAIAEVIYKFILN